jgi:pantothenate synthetase
MQLAEAGRVTVKQTVPELFVLHIGHVIVVSILKRFYNASVVSLFILPHANETIDNCEDDTDCGRHNLQLCSALERVRRQR